MTDRRLLAANGRVAAGALKGQVTAERFVTGTAQVIVAEVTDICTTPAGPRDRQLLRGATITQLEDRDGWSFIQSGDGYVGYISSAHCADATAPTHFIATQATHAYTAEDFKSPDVMSLPFPYQRGDIVFWKGHVGMMVDADTMIHANAHHMATAYAATSRKNDKP